jgi:hypothetical protein
MTIPEYVKIQLSFSSQPAWLSLHQATSKLEQETALLLQKFQYLLFYFGCKTNSSKSSPAARV